MSAKCQKRTFCNAAETGTIRSPHRRETAVIVERGRVVEVKGLRVEFGSESLDLLLVARSRPETKVWPTTKSSRYFAHTFPLLCSHRPLGLCDRIWPGQFETIPRDALNKHAEAQCLDVSFSKFWFAR
jgi:hypothetical protein